MPYRLPSLDALRVFEAAARHLSFTQAADELNVPERPSASGSKNVIAIRPDRTIESSVTADPQAPSPAVKYATAARTASRMISITPLPAT